MPLGCRTTFGLCRNCWDINLSYCKFPWKTSKISNPFTLFFSGLDLRQHLDDLLCVLLPLPHDGGGAAGPAARAHRGHRRHGLPAVLRRHQPGEAGRGAGGGAGGGTHAGEDAKDQGPHTAKVSRGDGFDGNVLLCAIRNVNWNWKTELIFQNVYSMFVFHTIKKENVHAHLKYESYHITLLILRWLRL